MKNLAQTLIILVLIFACHSVYSQKFEPVKDIPQGKALVYVYRPGSMVGAAVHYSVNANDNKVSEAHLKNGTYLVYFADPGRFTFWAQVSNSRRSVDLDVEAGKTYYVRGDCCALIIPDMEKADKEIVKCKLSSN